LGTKQLVRSQAERCALLRLAHTITTRLLVTP
jgi:hypothetical protein